MPEQIRKVLRLAELTLVPDILLAINQRPRQFTDLKRSIRADHGQEIHDSTFSRALRRLRHHQLVCRNDSGYHLTEAGHRLLRIIIDAKQWAVHYPDSLDPPSPTLADPPAEADQRG
ncbi:MAG: hypothetical protein JXA67_03575 [Micromonosporaceae bacterium]|nr:hypothetical protein [Micromonosporaceae bacterium]